MPAPIAPGTFTSTIDTGLPVSPRTLEDPMKDDLQSAYNAIQTLQQELELVKERLAAAGIP